MAGIKHAAPLLARDNPFAVDRVLQVRFRFESISCDELCARLESLNMRAAVVGPQGSGKTTLLEDLARRHQASGWRIRAARLSAEFPQFDRVWRREFFAALGPRDLVVFDGAEQLSRFAWRRFQSRTRRAGGLLITSHRAGLLPTLIETRTSLALLDDILRQLVPTAPQTLLDAAHQLFHTHHGNIRDVLRGLYDAWSRGE
jgi:hypothetical protein